MLSTIVCFSLCILLKVIDIKYQTFLLFWHDALLFQPCAVNFRNMKRSSHGNYSLHGSPIIFFFRTAIGFQNYVDLDHQLKMPGNGEHVL